MKKPVKKVTPKIRAARHAAALKAARTRAAKATPAVRAARHAAALKAARTRAAAKKNPRRSLALGEGVACCPAEALAASLRLTGRAVSDSEVLALHWLAGGSADAGVPILAALEAASAFGLAGVRPVSFEPVDLDDPAAVILGLDLPRPHAVLADGGDWWSWGEPYDPATWPDAIIEEAWEVTW